MTDQEIIKTIEDKICNSCIEECMGCVFNDVLEQLEDNSKLENYRTPMKVTGEYLVYKCPRCHRILAYAEQVLIYKAPCCPSCGQVLDWTI